MSCFKQLHLNYTHIFELLIHCSFVERLLFAAVGGLSFSFDNLLDSRSMTVFVRLADILKVSSAGKNILKICDALFLN